MPGVCIAAIRHEANTTCSSERAVRSASERLDLHVVRATPAFVGKSNVASSSGATTPTKWS